MRSAVLHLLCAGAICLSVASGAFAGNFTRGAEAATKFGVHEIELTGAPGNRNPNDAAVTVTFHPPSGQAAVVRVPAFYDGDRIWRARIYITEPGRWRFSCDAPAFAPSAGEFTATDSQLRGRLTPHVRNPRHWQTDDGRWFLNLNDTAYFLLSSHDGASQPVSDSDMQAYVRDLEARGVTSVRSFVTSGPRGFLAQDGTDRHRWHDLFLDEKLELMDLAELQTTDRRLAWMLDNHPEMYVQLILFPLGSRYGKDDSFWAGLTPPQKERVMRHLVARYAAFPQIFWLIANDVHYGPKFPNNNAFVREVGAYFQTHDPWRHPLSTGHARRVTFFFGNEDWATYIHLEDEADLTAAKLELYRDIAKPVFLGEDRYEQDHGPSRDPADMRYFQRRLFWAWLLSGGSANYGSRWWVVHPYSQSASRKPPLPRPNGPQFEAGLVGLDSVRAIRDYFAARRIELSDFQPAQSRISDPGHPATVGLKLMRRDDQEFLAYHPNAAVENIKSIVNANRTARLQIDLSTVAGEFNVEWFRALDGTVAAGNTVHGGGKIDVTAPWPGADVVLRLTQIQP